MVVMEEGDGEGGGGGGAGRRLHHGSENSSPMGLNMNQLRREGKLVDLLIVCGARSLPAHRIVLAASSPFFESLLVEDSQRNPTTTLDLEDVDASTMEELLAFIYLGKVRPSSFDSQHIIHLMTTAHLLKITGAERYLAEVLLVARPNRNLTSLWDWSEEFDSTEVEHAVLNYMVNNMATVWCYQDFCELTMERLTTVLAQPAMASQEQDMVMQAVLTWVKHDLPNRRELLPNFTCFIDFSQFTDQYMRTLVREEPLMHCCPELRSIITSDTNVGPNRMNPQASPTASRQFTTDNVHKSELGSTNGSRGRRRMTSTSRGGGRWPPSGSPKRNLEAMSGSEEESRSTCSVSPLKSPSPLVGSSPGQRTFSINDQPPSLQDSPPRPMIDSIDRLVHGDESDITSIAKPPSRGLSPTLVTAPGTIDSNQGRTMIVAGRDEANRTVVHYLKPDVRTFIGYLEIPIPAHFGESMGSLNGNVYIVGGEDMRKNTLRDAYVFNAASQVMRPLPMLRVPRSVPSVVGIDSHLMVIGGLSKFQMAMTHVESLDTNTETWKIVSSIKEKRVDPGVAVLNGCVYLIGGCTTRCEMFCPTDGVWQTLTPLPEIYRDEPVKTAAVEDRRLLTFRSHKPDRCCCYYPDKNQWQIMKVSGQSPDDVVSTSGRDKDVWVMDSGGKITVLDIRNNQWMAQLTVPKGLSRPMHLLMVND